MKVQVEGLSDATREKPKQMLSVHEGPNGKLTVYCNSSSLDILLTCERKSYYALYNGYVSMKQSSAITFGTAVHAALEHFYSSPKDSRSLPKDLHKKAEMIAYGGFSAENELKESAVLRALHQFVQTAWALSELGEHDKHSLQTGCWLLAHYFDRYHLDPYVIAHDSQGPIVERYVEYPLYDSLDLEIRWFGTIDCVLQNEQTGQWLVTDHKTTSRLGTEFLNRLKPNHQYTGYLLAAKHYLGLTRDEFLINALEVKPKPKTARGGPPQFPRQVTERSDRDYREFTETVTKAIRQYIEARETDQWSLGSANACSMYGGCQFLDVCRAPDNIRETILENNFIQPSKQGA